ncbi:MAG: hypothetical protein LBK61_04060 [Spirochaetaceae bacterium]|jgi:uncharacterized damage-inducible protein DinB|nr:hypothetical protein [Spirochaetaceae bacterium]
MDILLNIYKYYAQCNKAINVNMLKILKENAGIYNRKISGYYKSVNDILFHILDVDLSWMSDLKDVIHSKIFEEEIFLHFNANIEPVNQYKDINEFEKDRIILDALIIKFIDNLDIEDLQKKLVYKNNKIKRVWEILIHTFNHQTHHRGQISEILDGNMIENDFSNMIRYEIMK